MKLSSDFVGTNLKDLNCRVDARWTMNYAAATGDTNPLYYDDERAGGIIAPPVFPVAVTWPMIEHISGNIEDPDFPKEILFTQVHYSEQLVIHRPVKPGDELKVSGSIAAILPHKAGTHVILKFEAVDSSGIAVFTEYLGAMMRGVECSDSGKGSENVPLIPAIGESALLWENTVAVHPLTPFIYDGCSNIHFPIHTSVKFARTVGLPDIILQGTATLAIAVREVLNVEAAGDSRRVGSLSCQFTGMVLPGSDIKICLTGRVPGAEGSDLFFNVLNSERKRAISNGRIRLKA